MKKLFTLLTLAVLAIGSAWAEDVTIFSANPTAAWAVPAGTTDAEITSSYATISGGKMYLTNQQTSDKDMIKKQGEFAFQHTNNNTFFKVVLEQALKAGDVISARIQSRTDADLGLWFSTSTERPGSEPTAKIVLATAASQAWVAAPTYTVAEGDGICGETTFYIYRHTGKSTYFNTFTITRSVTDTRTDVTLTYAASTASVNLGESFTAPTLTVDPTAASSEVAYSSSNESVATVATDGAVTIKAAGTTTITAAIANSQTYKDASASYTLTVVDPNVKTVTATFPFDTGAPGQVATVSAENVFSVTSVGVADMTYAGAGSDQGITGTKMQPSSQASDDKSQYVKFTVTPKKGITFTPKKVSFDAMRWGTDGSNKLHYYAESGSTSKELGNVNPNRNGKGEGWSHYEHTLSDIQATSENPFSLACYVYGLGTTKQISFANVVIEGEYSGEAEEETMYAITTSVTPEGAGNVIQNPAGASLAEGMAVEFSATANTGYMFLNKWTVNGTEVDGATYSVESLSQDLEVVAQFKKLNAVSFSAGEGDKGTSNPLPTVYADATYTTPAANYYIAREGYTVTGWTDGENNYGFGDEITLTGDITLTPVFTANTKTIADTGTSDVTVTYGFDNTKNDPAINLENSTGYYVKQATFGGETIDVAMFIDNRDNAGIDGKRGKTNNVSRANAQVNTGSKFTIPAVAGMTVKVNVANGKMDGTTIAGEEFSGSYTYTGDAESIDIIFTSDALYINSLAVTYPRTATTVAVTSAGYRTFASSFALDFTNGVEGLKAYRAAVSNNVVSFSEIKEAVPAGEGMLLKAAEGNYEIPVATGATTDIDNALVGVLKDTELDGGIYVLMAGTADNKGTGFYKTTAEKFTVGAHTAYLPADVVSEARMFIGFEDATAIEEVATATAGNGKFFDLQGRSVAQPTKGLYIVNGKKVIMN